MSDVEISLFGPAVTRAHALEVGAGFVQLFDAVARTQGAPEGMLQLTGDVCWRCDGCKMTVPGPQRPATWGNDGEFDYCDACQQAL